MWFRLESDSSEPAKPEPSQIRLQKHIRAIAAQLDRMAADVAAGRRISTPMRPTTDPDDVRSLFVQIKDGAEYGVLYYFTDDFNAMNANAQVGLMQFFSKLLTLDQLVLSAADRGTGGSDGWSRPLLDGLRASALFYDMFLDRFPISTAILLREDAPEKLREVVARLNAEEDKRIRKFFDTVFDQKAALAALPDKRMHFVIQVTHRIDDGADKFINGVFFPKPLADKLLASMAEAQARSMAEAPATC